MYIFNQDVHVIDLGDQLFLETKEKTLCINSIGRKIYFKLKEGKTIDEIILFLASNYGVRNTYDNDIKAFVNQLLQYNIMHIAN